MKKFIIYTLYCIVTCVMMQGCSACNREEFSWSLFKIVNNSNFPIMTINAELNSAGDIVVATGKHASKDPHYPSGVGMCQVYMLALNPQKSTEIGSIHLPLEDEIKAHNGLRVCFVFGVDSEYPFLFQPAAEQLLPDYLAFQELSLEWLKAHDYTINFPEDCTVNPRLHEIYNLDEFVEKYGPLKAKGWDEAWAKWLEAKQANTEQ